MASDFEARGQVEVTPADGSGNFLWAETRRSAFTVSVHDEKWLVKSTTADGLCDLCGCDGTNVYLLTVQTNIPGAFSAEVARGQYPLGANTIFVTLPWLSVASSHFLDSAQENTMPAPWAFPNTDPSAFIYSTETRRFKTPPALPEEITFNVSAPLLKSAPSNLLLETGPLNKEVIARNVASLARYQPGFVGGRYVVLRSTNWNGLCFPEEATLTRYSAKVPTARVPFEVYRLKVESVSASHAESYLPELPVNATVADRRVRDPRLGIDLLQYRTPDGRWWNEGDPRLRRLLEERKGRVISSLPAVVQRKTQIARLALVLLALAPIAVLLLRRAYKRRTRPEINPVQ